MCLVESGFSLCALRVIRVGGCISILLSESCVDVQLSTHLSTDCQGWVSTAAVIIPAEVFTWTWIVISFAKYLWVEFQGHKIGVCCFKETTSPFP